jgi:hypothetical protein
MKPTKIRKIRPMIFHKSANVSSHSSFFLQTSNSIAKSILEKKTKNPMNTFYGSFHNG